MNYHKIIGAKILQALLNPSTLIGKYIESGRVRLILLIVREKKKKKKTIMIAFWLTSAFSAL
jgi:hypothetical protein